MVWILTLWACRTADTLVDWGEPPVDVPEVRLVGGGESGAELPEPEASVDLVIVGAGAGGLGAAAMAWEGGLDVVVLEAMPTAGGSAAWASRMWGAGTETQVAEGVHDSPELALLEWDEFTHGDATDPRVQNFVYASADVLGWLQSFGWAFDGVVEDAETGSVARVHEGGSPRRVVEAISHQLGDDLWLDTRMTGLVMAGGAVVGVSFERSGDGETGWVESERTLLATGGFARNDQRVAAAVPELAYLGWVHEALPLVDGSGLDVLEAARIPLRGLSNLGVYGHAVADTRFDPPRSLVGLWMGSGIVVDHTAQRVMDESLVESFGGGRALVASGHLWAVLDARQCEAQSFSVTPFDYDVATSAELPERKVSVEAYEAFATVPRGETIAALAAAMNLDAPSLTSTVDRYNDQVRAGLDEDYSKPMEGLGVLLAPPFRAFALQAGPSKSFGGAGLSTTGQVLGASGGTVPGLYAAGEVAGFLGTDAVGWGFAGSITAAWYGGLLAGEAVVGDLQATAGAEGTTPRRWRPVAE